MDARKGEIAPGGAEKREQMDLENIGKVLGYVQDAAKFVAGGLSGEALKAKVVEFVLGRGAETALNDLARNGEAAVVDFRNACKARARAKLGIHIDDMSALLELMSDVAKEIR